MLGPAIELVACRTFDQVFEQVNGGAAEAAVLPIENTLFGSIHRSYELLAISDAQIVGEVRLRIEHHLIARPGVAREDIRRVISHPVALGQCQRFLASLNVEAVAEDDTAGSVKLLMEQGWSDVAAIAGAAAAEQYGATIVVSNVEDHRENYTRFLLLARGNAEAIRAQLSAGPQKTSVLFRTPNVPASLFRALAAFALRDINLTKLESRPIEGRPWEYSFYVDIDGGAEETPVANALNHLREMCESVKVLGSYTAAG
ncbi:MAG TPA: prephenate dehydratase [Thermoanaerobaculia bacterium]|nr:prephenate dehydratase [Thermoanaerobaculia bacterium]